jgi:hypothetical protein
MHAGMKLRAIAIAALLFAACGGKKESTTPDNGGGGGEPVEPSGPPQDVVTLTEVSQGDAACYITVDDGGESVTHPGSFVLCPGGEADAAALVGKEVVLTFEKAQMMAGSWGGDPECPDTEEVDAVMRIELASP